MGIARKDIIPWSVKEDMMFFRKHTRNGFLIFGRKTWENVSSFGKKCLLHEGNRRVIIVSSAKGCASSLDDAIQMCSSEPWRNIIICGGVNLYKEALGYPNVILYYTHVYGNYECDVFFPSGWEKEMYLFDEVKTDECSMQTWVKNITALPLPHHLLPRART